MLFIILEFNPEFCPKWETLLDILKVEIPAEIKKSGSKENTTVLILCSDQRTCHQLNEVSVSLHQLLCKNRGWLLLLYCLFQLLTSGPHLYLFFLALKKKIPFKTLSSKFKNCGKVPEVAKSNESDEKTKPRNSKKLKTDKPDNVEKDTENTNEEADDEEFQSTYILTMNQSVLEDFDETTCKDQSSLEESIFTPLTQVNNIYLT